MRIQDTINCTSYLKMEIFDLAPLQEAVFDFGKAVEKT
jgi:hypothetical protein